MKKLLVAITVVFALVWGAWLIALPGDVMERTAEEALNAGGMSVDLVGFKKGLFYSFSCESVDFRLSGDRAFSVQGLSGRLDFLPLFVLKAVVPLKGSLGGGEIKGSVELEKGSYKVSLDARGVELAELGLYSLTGINAAGALSADVRLRDNMGKIKFTVDDARFEPFPIYGFKLPLDMFSTVRGALFVDHDTVDVESLALEGKEIYARVTGTLKGGDADLKLELMPEGDGFPDPVYDALLRRYRVSRGLYVIPIKSRLNL